MLPTGSARSATNSKNRSAKRTLLLKELQHRVKNNLQLVTALIRLEARAAQRGDNVDLNRLASRVDTLSLFYQALSTDHRGPIVDLGPYLERHRYDLGTRALYGCGIALHI